MWEPAGPGEEKIQIPLPACLQQSLQAAFLAGYARLIPGSEILLIMVHGFASQAHTPVFDELVRQLPRHSTLRFDLPGRGESPGVYTMSHGRERAVLEAVLEYSLREILPKIGQARPVFLGHSRGGASCLYLNSGRWEAGEDLIPTIGLAVRADQRNIPWSRYTEEEIRVFRSGGEIKKLFPGLEEPMRVTAEDYMERVSMDYTPVSREMTGRGIFASIHGTRDRVIPWSEALALTGVPPLEAGVIESAGSCESLSERSAAVGIGGSDDLRCFEASEPSPDRAAGGLWASPTGLPDNPAGVSQTAPPGDGEILRLERRVYLIRGATHNFRRHVAAVCVAVKEALDGISRAVRSESEGSGRVARDGLGQADA